MHQIELHPDFQQRELRDYHADKGILTEAWSPLGQGGDILKHPVITEIAEAHGADAGQVIIAWHLAIGNVVIPKTVTPERIVSNFAAADLRLTDEQIEKIDGLDRADGRVGPDPADPGFGGTTTPAEGTPDEGPWPHDGRGLAVLRRCLPSTPRCPGATGAAPRSAGARPRTPRAVSGRSSVS